MVDRHASFPDRRGVARRGHRSGSSAALRRAVVMIAAFVAVVLPLAVVPPALAAQVDVQTKRQGDAVEVRASATLDVDAATIWRVLTDFARHPEFVPDLRDSRIVERGDTTMVVAQTGVVRVWLLSVPVEVTYEVEMQPRAWLRKRSISGSLKSFDGEYRLSPAGAGTLVEYTGRLVPGALMSMLLDERVVRDNAQRHFRALLDEVERVAAASGPQGRSGAR